MKTGAAVRSRFTGQVGRVLGRSTMRGYLRVQFERYTDICRRDQLQLLADRFEDWALWESRERE